MALSGRSVANENDVMEVLASFVIDVERDSNKSHDTIYFGSTHGVLAQCVDNGESTGPVAAADWEIKAAFWQLFALLDPSSSKRVYEGKGKKEQLSFLFCPLDNLSP